METKKKRAPGGGRKPKEPTVVKRIPLSKLAEVEAIIKKPSN
jgi:hypothetical protein